MNTQDLAGTERDRKKKDSERKELWHVVATEVTVGDGGKKGSVWTKLHTEAQQKKGKDIQPCGRSVELGVG